MKRISMVLVLASVLQSSGFCFAGALPVLSRTYLMLENGQELLAIDLLKKINRLRGDRIYVQLDSIKFNSWIKAGGKFRMLTENVGVESGKFNFCNCSQYGGSLHDGYDLQGFSSVTKTPRLQINYRVSDSEADIDLDGYTPFIGGIIPNPNHLTYENSDVRFWFDSYLKKFGNPGFEVVPVKNGSPN